jgi:Domain of unknown function (DUF4388)
MSLTGCLVEYSLVEIFNFIQDGNKTGLLSIEADRCLSRSIDNAYDIAFQSGRIMSVTNGRKSGSRGLIEMMAQRQWLSPEQITGLSFHAKTLQQPLGTYLKACNSIDTEQLKLLFDTQVTANICKLFGEHHHGRFHFDPHAPLIYAEMTGISLTAKETTLLSLRMLRDWSGFSSKLPAPAASLQRFSTELPTIRLDSQESKIWKLALGELSIAQISTQLGLEIEKVQQIAFRLMAIGLVEKVSIEIDFDRSPIDTTMDLPTLIVVNEDNDNTPPPVSTSFLSNLMGFLKRKG